MRLFVWQGGESYLQKGLFGSPRAVPARRCAARLQRQPRQRCNAPDCIAIHRIIEAISTLPPTVAVGGSN
jgi:hypothetical protein